MPAWLPASLLLLAWTQPGWAQSPPPPPFPPPPPPPATPLRPVATSVASASATGFGSVQVLLNYTDFLGTWANTYTLSAGAQPAAGLTQQQLGKTEATGLRCGPSGAALTQMSG